MDLDPRTVAQLDEREWYRHYTEQPQLTLRAVISGSVLGFALSAANVYIGLRTGWFFSMALTACLASFGAWRLFGWLGLARKPLSLLEANCAQSTASSAAYATGNMVVGVVPAMLLLSVSSSHPEGHQPHWAALASWIACIAALGITLAIPLKRQLINRERLAFPSGTAAAITLHSLHRSEAGARGRARVLLAATSLGALLPLLRDIRGAAAIARSSRVFDFLPRFSVGATSHAPSDAGLVLDHSFLLVAAGVFVGLRIALWMVIGGLITAFVLAPVALDATWIDPRGHTIAAAQHLNTAWLEVGLWAGAPMLVSYGAVALAGSWRVLAQTFTWRPKGDPAPSMEIPIRWFWIGFPMFGGLAIILGFALFDIPPILGALAVVLSFAFSGVAARITGETDITPGGPMGKLTQLVFGAVRPQHPTTNLMTAAMTHASSVASADLLNDLKSGYLLGANPRRQLIAQAIGVAAGATASVLAYFLLVPDARTLAPTDGSAPIFAAPAAHQFRAIAELMQHGIDSLHPMHRWLVVAGGVAGLVLGAIERASPPKVVRWMPASAGLGLGLLLPLSTSISMLIGAALAQAATRMFRDASERIVWPISAGLLAGESLAGVIVAIVNHLSA